MFVFIFRLIHLCLISFFALEDALGFDKALCKVKLRPEKGNQSDTIEITPEEVNYGVAGIQSLQNVRDAINKAGKLKRIAMGCQGFVKLSTRDIEEPSYMSLPNLDGEFLKRKSQFMILGTLLTKNKIKFKQFRPAEIKQFKSVRFLGPLENKENSTKEIDSLTIYEGETFNGPGKFFEVENGEEFQLNDTSINLGSYVLTGKAHWKFYIDPGLSYQFDKLALAQGKDYDLGSFIELYRARSLVGSLEDEPDHSDESGEKPFYMNNP